MQTFVKSCAARVAYVIAFCSLLSIGIALSQSDSARHLSDRLKRRAGQFFYSPTKSPASLSLSLSLLLLHLKKFPFALNCTLALFLHSPLLFLPTAPPILNPLPNI